MWPRDFTIPDKHVLAPSPGAWRSPRTVRPCLLGQSPFAPTSLTVKTCSFNTGASLYLPELPSLTCPVGTTCVLPRSVPTAGCLK